MLIPYLKAPIYLNSVGKLLLGSAHRNLNHLQAEALRHVIRGDWAPHMRSPASKHDSDNSFLSSAPEVLNSLRREFDFLGWAHLDIQHDPHMIIVDRGWGGVYQNALDLWQYLNRSYRVLLLAPADPPYGVPEALLPLLVTPNRWQHGASYVSFLSLARAIIRSLPSVPVMFTHRAVTPYFFDLMTNRPTIIYGDAYFEGSLVVAGHLRPKPPARSEVTAAIQELYYGVEQPCASLTHAYAYYWAFIAATEIWSWTPTEYSALRKCFPELAHRHRLVPPMIDTDACAPSDTSARPARILFTTTASGTRLEPKGLGPLLSVLPMLPRTVKVTLVLGDTNYSLPVAAANDTRVEILRCLSKSQIIDVYRGSAVSCRLSSDDSAPVSVLEAMACGTPVIVSPLIAANIPCIKDGVNGFIIDPLDHVTLAKRVRFLLENPEGRHACGAAARETAMQHAFSTNVRFITKYWAADNPPAAAARRNGGASDNRATLRESLR